MTTIQEASDELAAAAETVVGIRAYTDPAADVDPPGVVVGPPQLQWEGACAGPTSARFLLYVVVDATDRAMTELWDLVPKVADAVDRNTDAAVIDANPGTWADQPAYILRVEASL